MAGKCCKSETSTGGCPVMKSSCDSEKCGDGSCVKKSSGCKISDALGVPPCVILTAAAIALVGITAAITVKYNKSK